MSKKLSSLKGALLLVTTMLGYGVLCVPKATAQVGIINALILICGTAFLTFNSVYLFFKVCEKKAKEKNDKTVSFSDLIGKNKIFILFINLITALICFGGVTSYAGVFSDYVPSLVNISKEKYSLYICLGFSIMHLGIGLLKDLSFLSYASLLSIGSCFLVGSVIVFYFFSIKRDEIIIEKVAFNFKDAAGSFIFSLFCQTLVPTVYSSLRHDASILNISILSSSIGCIIVVLYGMLGYMTSGKEISVNPNASNILSFYALKGTAFRNALASSIEKKGYLIKVSQFLFLLLLNCSYIFLHVPGRQAVIDIISEFVNLSDITKVQSITSFIVSCLFVFGSLILSRFEFHTNIVNYIGLYLMNTLGFIIPGIIYLQNFSFKNKLLGIMSVFEIVVGVGLIIVLTYFKFKN